MAYETGGNPGGAIDDPYSDAGMSGGEADDAKPKTDETKPEEATDDSIEAVLPKSILAGKHFDVGDEVVLKITAMHDDEIRVKYAPAKKDESEGKEPGEGKTGEMASMEPDGGPTGGEYD